MPQIRYRRSRWAIFVVLAVGGLLVVLTHRMMSNGGTMKTPPSSTSGAQATPVAADWIACLRHLGACGDERDAIAAEKCVDTLRRGSLRSGTSLRIACVGDSITYGNGSHATIRKLYAGEGNYPVELQSFLRSNLRDGAVKIEVGNFGKGGNTATDTPASFSYRRSPEFKASKKVNPHIVIFMLGTNDSKPKSWKGPESFSNHLDWFHSEYKGLLTQPQLVIMAPPPSLSRLGRINGSVIQHEIVPLIMAVPTETRWSGGAIDLNTPFMDLVVDPITKTTASPDSWPRKPRGGRWPAGVPKPYGVEWLHDGVHPTIAGHKLIADLVASHLCKRLAQCPV